MNMPAIASMGWNWADLVTFTAAWALMMAAMMLPSAAPMVALYSTVVRRRGFRTIAGRTTMFAAPYVALWALSGIPVYASTVWIDTLNRSHAWAQGAAPYAVAITLLAAGIYQFTPLKRMCLANCRNPLNFLVSHWRPGLAGAAQIGFAHAVYCFGCCALLMVVLVAAGAMGLVWVLLIAGAVAFEKLAPRWLASPAIVGAAMVVLGAAVALHPSLVSNLRS
jgi:predicted metal-binding membrane protein